MKGIAYLLDKLFFAVVLLVGIQVPNFVTQYQKILGAHYQEAAQQLNKYQQVANQFYAGNIDKLLAAHQNNAIPAIRGETKIIAELIQRSDYLQQQLKALRDQPLLSQLQYLLQNVDTDFAKEVLTNYVITLPLNSEAIIFGLSLALVCSITVTALLAGISTIFYPKKKRTVRFDRS